MKAGVRVAMVWVNARVAYVYMRRKMRCWKLDESESAGPLYIATRQLKISTYVCY